MQGQLVPNRHVDQNAGVRGFIHFGKNAACQIIRTAAFSPMPVGLDHFIQGVAMARGVEQQEALDRTTRAAQHGNLR